MTTRPSVGDLAPTPTMIGLDGERFDVADRWRERPLVLSFLRYFGCPFCQAWVGTLSSHRAELETAGVGALVVGQGTANHAREFMGARRPAVDVAVDPDRSAYRAFGLGDGGIWQIAQPAVAAAWISVQVRGRGRQGGLRGGSLTQMPGTFLVDTAGVVRFAHRNRHQADDPDVGVLLAACRSIAA